MPLDYSSLLRDDLPPPAAQPWSGFPAYNFVGGNVDGEHVPTQGLIDAAARVLAREGQTLATYNLESGPQGYLPLRRCVAEALARRTGMATAPEEVLITSGSNHAIELVGDALLAPGDTLLIERETYGGKLSRLKKREVNVVGVPLDEGGIQMDALDATLRDLAAKGIKPKYIYTIPTVQNPTGTVMSRERRLEMLEIARRHGILIFEDDCYADLLWAEARPPTIRSLDAGGGQVIYCGSYSKSIAPALRIGYLVADWDFMRHVLPLKTDGGTGALTQMLLAEYAAGNFDAHVEDLNRSLQAKLAVMVEAVESEFGTSAEFAMPKGGIVFWIKLPDEVDTSRLAQAAAAEGVAINPGAEWVCDPDYGRSRLRLCFANPSETAIRDGVAKLAEICHREFGVPTRSGNIER